MITPALSFSESALAENVRRLDLNTTASSRRWAVRLTSAVPINLLRNVILPVRQMASCSHIADAEYLADAGFRKIILTGRVVDSESLTRLRCLAERTQIVAVIDHFRHAELLSQSVSQSDGGIQILIEVDVGRQSSGVQPGSDAVLLAAAASQLPGLKVVGVFASAMDFPANMASLGRPVSDRQASNAVSGVPVRDLATVVRIVNHAARSLLDVADCPETVVAVSSIDETSIGEAQINCLIASPFFREEDCLRAAVKSPVCVMATVISRPALERCVIDVGRIVFGDPAGVRVESPSGASILHVMQETCTLHVSGDSSDLRIGDRIQITVANPEFLLNRPWIR